MQLQKLDVAQRQPPVCQREKLGKPATLARNSCRKERQLSCRAASASYEIWPAKNSAELRSIASLRAVNFYECARANIDDSRSDIASKSHVRLKADAIWTFLEESYTGRNPEGQAKLVCFFATILDTPGSATAAAMRQAMDLSCTLPADGTGPSRIVIGSLDLTRGSRLGGERLAGRLPGGEGAQHARAYLSNVSVAPAARRQGVASALIAAAHRHASQNGVQHLYVHAAMDNRSALALYGEHCGFEVEQTEGADLARALNRPKRVLFHKTVLPLNSLKW